MKATTLQQPHATLVALGVQTIITDKRRAPQALIGQTIAIHAGKHKPHPGDRFGEGWIGRSRLTWPDRMDETFTWGNAQRGAVVLPLGAIVATATLADCVPMVDGWRWQAPDTDSRALLLFDPPYEGEASSLRTSWGEYTATDSQLPYGDFRPGRWAWLLTDVKPTTERCPACMGTGQGDAEQGWYFNGCLEPGSVPPCDYDDDLGSGTCPPIPAKGKPGLWEWQP